MSDRRLLFCGCSHSGQHHANCPVIQEFDKIERENAAMREAIREAEQLLLAVDDGAQQDINGSNWYDARQKFISKLQPFLKP